MISVIIITIAIIWGGLTIWAEMPRGANKQWEYGPGVSAEKVLIVYNPDPFYNLDEQVCKAFAEELAARQIHATVSTVLATQNINTEEYTAFVCCANTYNWRPDVPVSNFIKTAPFNGKKVIAITLGSGSTQASKRTLDKRIKATGANLVDSKTLWLLRPNDESRMDEKNVTVAVDMVHQWAARIIPQIFPGNS